MQIVNVRERKPKIEQYIYILAFLTISHLETELRKKQGIFLHAIAVHIIVPWFEKLYNPKP